MRTAFLASAATLATMHGYGVRWDRGANCWRVLNETTRMWMRDKRGDVAGWSDFAEALAAHRQFEPPVRQW
jgi:hypothetical protein